MSGFHHALLAGAALAALGGALAAALLRTRPEAPQLVATEPAPELS